MQTRLSRICDAIIEAGWLTALIVTPLFFNTASSRVFEPDKLHLLRSVALVMAAAWVIQLLDGGWPLARAGESLRTRLRSTPLALPTLILVAAYLVSTALSVIPRISFWGSYVRLQGTYTFLSYVVIFAMVLTHLRHRGQVNRLLLTVVLTSLPVSLYAILQHFGHDPLPWAGDVRERVAANMGNAIFVAAYLIIAVFLTLNRLVESMAGLLDEQRGGWPDVIRVACYLFVLAVQLAAILFTQSRGPWMGLGAGLYVFGMVGLLLLGRWAAGRSRMPRWLGQHVRTAWLALIGLTMVGGSVVAVLNVPGGPLAGLCQRRYVARICTLGSLTEGTNAVRVLIWEGVVDMMLRPHPPIQYPDGTPDAFNAIRPLIGYGPESMWVAYNRFYPPELAHYEARNASPDRSHNETFDALVRTGLLGFGAQLFLFGSIFYYGLRWLGLIRGRGRRYLFLGLMAGGAALGVIVPVLADGSLRLAGLGLPSGLILGLILYLTVDLLLTPTGPAASGATDAGAGTGSGRRQLLILSLLSAIVAFFVEVHFGIAIASTLTHFWIVAAALVAVGMGWTDGETTAEPAIAPATPDLLPVEQPRRRGEPLPAAVAVAAGRGATRGGAGAQARRPARPGETRPGPGDGRRQPPGAARETRAAARPVLEPMARTRVPSPIAAFLPYAGIGALITLVLVWDYLVNQTGARAALAILWNAFTTRVDPASRQVIQSPMLLVLMAFTWLVGGGLSVAEGCGSQPSGRRCSWLGATALHAGTVVGVFLVYGLFQAARLNPEGLSGLSVFHHLANHIVAFDVALFMVMMGLAAGLWLADPRPIPLRWWGRSPVLTAAGGALAVALALLVIVRVNIQTVRADIYYKQGLAYEGAGIWESSAILYLEAARLQPQEDYYDLFLGRALLQMASTAKASTATLPADLDGVPTPELLSLVERGLRSRGREDVLRAAHAALVSAQRLNPLNTDHSANLARLFRAWAFVNAGTAADVQSNAQLRQLAATRPDQVDVAKLEKSLAYWRQATSLSPNNVQHWNDMALVQYLTGDTEGAIRTLEHSARVDPQFGETFLAQGDLLAASGDTKGALEAFRAALALAPQDARVLSAIGVYSARVGDAAGALAAFRQLSETQSSALGAAQTELATLDAQARRSGGYAALGPTAESRRQALQSEIAALRSQLQLTYRNVALVLRDAGRVPEALSAARTALSLATDEERGPLETLIIELEKRSSP